MYGLKQATILAYKLLVKRLTVKGYNPIPLTNELFKYTSRKTIFAPYVDDFYIKYYSKEGLLHLQNTLQEYYDVSIDAKEGNYCGSILDWYHEIGYVDV